MKPRCPIPDCGCDIGANRLLCDKHWSLVPRALVNDISSASAIIKQTRRAVTMQAAFRRHRQAKERAIQFVMDKQNEKVSA